ncbi:MAG: hypothetical protein JNL90_21145 [Planctomycetes bacterium]|nr:hypothetical protein [Planctomycetota bacterium]
MDQHDPHSAPCDRVGLPSARSRWLHPGWLLAPRRLAFLLAMLWLLAQSPFLYLVVRHGGADDFAETLWVIVRHAPNQFLFLPLFLPFALFALWKQWEGLFELERRFPDDYARSRTWRAAPLLLLFGALPLALAIAAKESSLLQEPGPDSYHDWYQQSDWEGVREAAKLSRAIAKEDCFKLIAGEEKAGSASCASQIGARSPRSGLTLAEHLREPPDRVLLRLEALELASMLFSVALAFLGAGVAMRHKLSARVDPATGGQTFRYSAALREATSAVTKPTMLAALGFAMFVPMRAHNLAEVRSIVWSDTIHPYVMMAGVLLLLAFGAVARFGAGDSIVQQATESIVGAAAIVACLTLTIAPRFVASFMSDLNAQMIGCLVFVFGAFFWLVHSVVNAPPK